jgi:hypothetical protein
VSTGDRRLSTTPVQALFLMNNPFVHRQAEKLADRLLAEGPDDGHRVHRAYELVLGRPPAPDELAACESYLRRARETLTKTTVPAAQHVRTAWATLAQVLFSSNEFAFVD